MNILVVDDEQIHLDSMEIGLKRSGLTGFTALSGQIALGILENADIDVVITDYAMPGINGMDLLKRIRETDPFLPVIMMTAHGDKNLVVQALKHRCSSFIEKPFTLNALITEIKRVISNKDSHTLAEARKITVKAAAVSLPPHATDANLILEECLTYFSGLFQLKGMVVTKQLSEKPIQICQGRFKLDQVLNTLLLNETNGLESLTPVIIRAKTYPDDRRTGIIEIASSRPADPMGYKPSGFGPGSRALNPGAGMRIEFARERIESGGGKMDISHSNETGSIYRLALPLCKCKTDE